MTTTNLKRDDIRLVVQRSLEHCRLVRENARFRDEARAREPGRTWWAAVRPCWRCTARGSCVRWGSTVLIEGESGTGKELIARAVHLNSPRRDKFIPVNCGHCLITRLSLKAFGYEKGGVYGSRGIQGRIV